MEEYKAVIRDYLIDEILTSLYHYYPQNISAYSVNYDTSLEIFHLQYVLDSFQKNNGEWLHFINVLHERLGKSFFIRDTSTLSTLNVSYSVLANCTKEGQRYAIVLHHSLLLPYHCYYVVEYNAISREDLYELHKNNSVPDYGIKIYWNSSVPALEKEVELVLSCYEEHMGSLEFPTDLLNYIVPNVATQQKEANTVTMFDLLFSGYIYDEPY